MNNYTWKNISEEQANDIKNKLISLGGIERDSSKDEYKKWSIKFYDAIFDYYVSKKGNKIYCNGSKTNNPQVAEIYDYIDNLTDNTFNNLDYDFFIGLDESGKGEIAGHLILTAVLIPKNLMKVIKDIIGAADTKQKRNFNHWDAIFQKIDKLKNRGLIFIIEKIPPWIFDKYNVNKIIDVTYQRNLAVLFKEVDLSKKIRLTIDNYGVGDNLKTFLNYIQKQGIEVNIWEKADDDFLEAKLASIISKWQREAVIKAINDNKDFEINGIKIGSGNVGNSDTKKWIEEWYKSGKEWPWFIKKSFKTIRELEGKPKVKKLSPPFNLNLLSDEFKKEFSEGKLSIKTFSIVCPKCGNILKSVRFKSYLNEKENKFISGIECENCNYIITDADFTIRYYLPFILPDTNALSRSIISNDLNHKKFFQDFYIIISDVVYQELDGTPKGKKELEKLRKFANKGVIKLQYLEKTNDVINMKGQSFEKDDIIIKQCIEQNTIFLTGDKSAASKAQAKGVFTIFI